MRIFAKRTLSMFALTALLSGISSPIQATNLTWVGTTNDMSIASNWAPAFIPTNADDGIFNVGALSLTPGVLPNTTVNLHSLNFPGTSPSGWAFAVDGQNMGPAVFNIGNGLNGGIFNSTNSAINFTIQNNGLLHFLNGSTADAQITPNGTSNFSVLSLGSPNELRFSGATAGRSTIQVNGQQAKARFESNADAQTSSITLTNSGILEFDSSTANTAAINGTNSTVNFTGNSTAVNSTFNLTSSTLFFSGSASLGNATLTLNSTMFNFNSSNSASTAKMTLSNNSSFLASNSVNFSSLASDSSSAIQLFGALTINNTDSTTLAGPIQGNGSLVKNGTGTITITGSSNNWGTTAINAGTVIASSQSLSSGNISNLNGTLFLVQDADGSYSGDIQAGTGTLVKTGLARLEFSNSNSSGFHGLTQIIAGTVSLQNSTLGGNVFIDLASSLVTTGSNILGNVTLKNGKISPQGSFGDTLHIGGNYVQNPNGTYEVTFRNQILQNSLIDVDGTANIGGTLLLTLLDGVVDESKVYTILHADGGITGTFQSVVVDFIPLYVPKVIYTPNDVLMTIQFVVNAAASTFNEQQVSPQIQTIDIETNTPAEIALLVQLIGLSGNPATLNDARAGLTSLSGEQYSNVMLSADVSGRQFLRRLYEPLRQKIVAGGNVSSRDVYYNCYESDGCYCLGDKPWVPSKSSIIEPWLEIGGGHSFLRHDSNAHGYQSNNYQITFGVQTTALEIWTIGLAGGYEHEKIHYNLSGTCNNDVGQVALYTLVRPCGGYWLADFAYGWGAGKVKRPVTVGSLSYQARSKPTFCQALFYTEFGTDITLCSCLLQPFVGIEVNTFWGRKIVESNATPVNLTINKKNRTSALSRLGVHFSGSPWSQWSFNFDLAWQYRFTSTSNQLEERFQNFGNSFKIKGVSIPRNSLDGAANITYTICDRWELYAVLSGERWSRGSLYNVLAGFKYEF